MYAEHEEKNQGTENSGNPFVLETQEIAEISLGRS